MINENEVLVNINLRNKSYYENLGYVCNVQLISGKSSGSIELYIKVEDLNPSSTIKITAICEICHSENIIQYNKYIVNKNRNNKGYYSCFGCKNVEREKTNIKKFGVKSYSLTDEFKEKMHKPERTPNQIAGYIKQKETMMERYGVTSYFKMDSMKQANKEWMSSDEFKEKSKKTMLTKFGVDHFSKTDEFKKIIESKKDEIVEKIKKVFLEKYGVDWVSKIEDVKLKNKDNLEERTKKIKNTCIERYGVDSVFKIDGMQENIKITKIGKGLIIPDDKLNDWDLYKRQVRKLTNRNKPKLFTDWDGTDYYDGESIKQYLGYKHTHRLCPSVDHKISLFFGFSVGMSAEEISSIDNLCITKHYINSSKNKLNEIEFLELLDIKKNN